MSDFPDPAEAARSALREIERLAGGGDRPSRRRRRLPRPRWVVAVLAALVLPFLLLVRGAAALHEGTDWPAGITVLVSAVGTTLVLAAVGGLAARRFGLRPGRWAVRLAGIAVAAFCAYGLLYMSPDRFKRAEVADTYHRLHPVLRLAVSSLVLLDDRLVITDAERVSEDYARMGLPVNARSLHFRQADGYVHALDLRTRGRSEFAIALQTGFLRAAGLRVLRHTGTADHLHAYLAPR